MNKDRLQEIKALYGANPTFQELIAAVEELQAESERLLRKKKYWRTLARDRLKDTKALERET